MRLLPGRFSDSERAVWLIAGASLAQFAFAAILYYPLSFDVTPMPKEQGPTLSAIFHVVVL